MFKKLFTSGDLKKDIMPHFTGRTRELLLGSFCYGESTDYPLR